MIVSLHSTNDCKTFFMLMSTSLYIVLVFTQKIYATIITGSNIDCSGDNSCLDHTLACIQGADCTINCDGENACKNTTVLCPVDYACQIDCYDGNSRNEQCRYMHVNATKSSSLLWNCASGPNDCCDDMVLYCPINGHSGPITCEVTGASESEISGNVCIYSSSIL